jgi:DNA-binding HxlR family transcriptional regulator
MMGVPMSTESPSHIPQLAPGLPPRGDWEPVNDHCAIARTLGVVSTRTAFLIMREAFYGATRFDQFAERAQVSEPVAAARLRELTEAGLLEKVPYREPGQRTRYEYQLTDQGADLLPTLLALFDWGERWLFPNGARIGFNHAGCGAPVHAVIACEAGHPVSAAQIEITRRR